MEDRQEEQSSGQLKKEGGAIEGKLTPSWINVLKNIFGRWETWVALTATGGAVTYFTTTNSPADNNGLNMGTNVDNQVQTELNLNDEYGNSGNLEKAIDILLKDLFKDVQILPEVGLEDTIESDIPGSAYEDVQKLLNIYDENKL
ncbi:MAG: hypothetical protein U9M89_00530 [Patescibacteria group bacterium]|nr:hypothetical protein [Patescibacteria group bacterium]